MKTPIRFLFTLLCAAIASFLILLALFSPVHALSSPPGGCDSPGFRDPDTVPKKTVNIKNNSGVPIYVVLEAAKQIINGEDRWLQAEFQPTKGTYASTYLYRAYVNPPNGPPPNPPNGIPAGGSVSVTLPFYTQLESTPCPDEPDQYINWWRALRIYVYDDQGAINNAYQTDSNPANAVPIPASAAPVPTCPACAAPLVVYRDQTGGDHHGVSLPLNDPQQLLEFTFALVPDAPAPLQINHGFVDYDISSVDQVYLSVAMDPVNNPYIGFIGSVLGRDVFSGRLAMFQQNFSWPKYRWPAYVTNQTAIRLPATFNVMNEIAHPGDPPPIEPSGQALKDLPVIRKMEQLWGDCCGAAWPSVPCQRPAASSKDTCNKMAQVAELFEKNYDNYRTLCKDPVPVDRDQMMAKVYGWVPFKTCPNGDVPNELDKTPGIGDYHAITRAYVDLQYHSPPPPDPTTFGDFNRYTELIHSPNYLHVGEYAFSIDDAAGNMLEVGDGVNITVGGANGLGNTNPYDPWRFFVLNIADAPDAGPTWKKYRVCTAEQLPACASLAPDRDINETGRDLVNHRIIYAGIKIGAVNCPCVIVLQDSNDKLYKVLVERLPQPPPTHPINVEGEPPTAEDNGWTEKDEQGFKTVKCFDAETDIGWCTRLIPNIVFDNAVQRSVYYVNTSEPVSGSTPGIQFGSGKIDGTLSADRQELTVTWPAANTQPRGRPVIYQLTLWDQPNCPTLPDGKQCPGQASLPLDKTCDKSQTQCTVRLSKLVPPLTADTLKSIEVRAQDLDNPPHIAIKQTNFK